jgi:methylmalonyl-CoA mutase N-terminal domain/subunit
MLRFHVHTSGSVLTAQQVDNNVVRIGWQAMAAVLGGCQSLATCAKDEAVALPTEESATLALRTQQMVAYESGVTDTVDPLGGSYYIEALTEEIERKAEEYIKKIDELGGAVAAIEKGYMQVEIANSGYKRQLQVETGEQVVIGVNKFTSSQEEKGQYLTVDPSVGERQIAKVNKMKASRDNAAVKASLDKLRVAAQGEDNLMPYFIEAVKTYATLGEICGVLREEFGEFKASVYF